jgi:hypothetical protein
MKVYINIIFSVKTMEWQQKQIIEN